MDEKHIIVNYTIRPSQIRLGWIINAFMLILFSTCISAGQNFSHPRLYISNDTKEDFKRDIETSVWKNKYVDQRRARVEKYLRYCQEDQNWLVSRLQMNWKTTHDKVYLKGGDFSHSSGKAPVPTVRFSGSRDWAAEYRRPPLEEVEPYFDDPRGFYLKNQQSGEKEWVHPAETGFMIDKTNEQLMSIASDAAFLYWYTDDPKYAELAAPVFLTYIEGMFYRDAPIDLENSNQQHISGLATFEVIHEGILISLVSVYDFLHDYLEANGYNLQNSVAVFQKWGDQIIKNGIPDNNWNLFQARFLTYIAIVLDHNESYENGKGRQYFLDHTFNTSTDRQIALSESLLEYDQNTGIWPESASYSVHVITTLLRIITLLDHATNNNELANYDVIEKASLASFQYLFPNGYTIGFGDSKHKPLPPENFELLISNYRKYGAMEKEKLMSHLLNQMIEDGLYERKVKDLFQLFFYVDHINVDPTEKSKLSSLVTPTFYAPNVSLFNQRLGTGDEAIMASIAGSKGNHTHANGISLELFANNYAMGPDMGKGPSYWHEEHRDFYSRFPAHNTVVVDRRSDYEAMRSNHPFTIENSYPKSGNKTSDFDKITYAHVSFLEPTTISEQQRFTALIKSNLLTERGYVVDVFRSMKQGGGDELHEYIYHNIGQKIEFKSSDGQLLTPLPTEELNASKGELKGFNYFTDQGKIETAQDVTALFAIESEDKVDNLMKVWIKGDEGQTIFSVKSPKSNAISEGTAPADLVDSPLPTFIISKQKESWESPFALVFNPYFEEGENPIANVVYSSIEKYPRAQIIEVALSDGETKDQLVINASENDIAKNDDFYQNGFLSVKRFAGSSGEFDFLFLSGMNKYQQDGWEISAIGKVFTAAIERSTEGYTIHSDQPIEVILKHPLSSKPPVINFYENGINVGSRNARRNRHNEQQVIFKIDKKYEKVELTYPSKIKK